MTETRRETSMGELIRTIIDLPVEATGGDEKDRPAALAWTLSDETRETMREIDASIRAAEQLSGSLLVG